MKNYIVKLLLGLSVISILVSCGDAEIEILADKYGGVLIFDETDTLVLDADSSIFYTISTGSHTMIYNNQKPEEFRVHGKGGILNIGKRRFVRMTGIYNYGNKHNAYGDIKGGNYKFHEDATFKSNAYSVPRSSMLTIDSTVYILMPRVDKMSDKYLKEYLERHENYIQSSIGNNMMKSYDSILYIHKEWDYGLKEEFPEEILASQNGSRVIKTKLIDERLFLLYAMLNPENIKVINLRALNFKKDKTDTIE